MVRRVKDIFVSALSIPVKTQRKWRAGFEADLVFSLFSSQPLLPPNMISHAVNEVTTSTFDQEVLRSPVPVLVDFWADWCGPCKMLSPVLDEIASERGEACRVIKVNVDDESELAVQFGIRNIPSLFFFKGGELIHKTTGVQAKSEILKRLDTLIG